MPTNRIEGRTAVFADWAWQALLVTGMCSVGVGITLAVWPNKSVTVEGTLCGLVLLATAAFQLIAAFGANIATPLKVLQFLGGVTALLLALWCINSGQWVLLLALWIGMGWMVRGVVLAITAAWSDEFVGSGWQEIIGLVTAGVGMVVAVGPFESIVSLSIAVGLCTALLGASEIWTAARVEHTGVGVTA